MNKYLLSALGLFTTINASASDSIARGEEIYKQICHTCHAPDLSGGIGPSLVDPYWKHGDTPEAILRTISDGITGSEMIAYKHIYKENDLKALRDFIMFQQEDMRSLTHSTYPRDHFKEKRFSLDQLKTVESLEQKNVKENLLYFKHNYDGVAHFQAKLHVVKDGHFQFKIRTTGRTSVFLDKEEIFYEDVSKDKKTFVNKKIMLKKGVYDLDIMNEERQQHNLKLYVELVKDKGHSLLMGKDLEGSEPKVILPQAYAQVLRKSVPNISPRTLLCLLPNKTLVAYNPYLGKVEGVWKNSKLDQTPSINARSATPSQIIGEADAGKIFGFQVAYPIRFLEYQVINESVQIKTRIGGVEQIVTISPGEGSSYQVTGKVKEDIDHFEVIMGDQNNIKSNGNFELSFK